ncbi:hypothetical protein Fmac_005732 [Flemingia macrophylla]|uniref:Uncharacterized protein n=1 Tax=Flemingia macrophylla TaxID=520843 RepID=A0ABD1N9P5_9FABA
MLHLTTHSINRLIHPWVRPPRSTLGGGCPSALLRFKASLPRFPPAEDVPSASLRFRVSFPRFPSGEDAPSASLRFRVSLSRFPSAEDAPSTSLRFRVSLSRLPLPRMRLRHYYDLGFPSRGSPRPRMRPRASHDILANLERLLDQRSFEPWSHRRLSTPTATFPAIINSENDDSEIEFPRICDKPLSVMKLEKVQGLAIRKKLQQIEMLEAKQSNGHLLDDQQLAKLQLKSELESSLAEVCMVLYLRGLCGIDFRHRKKVRRRVVKALH